MRFEKPYLMLETVKISVTDANIFIDLLYLKVHSHLFNIGLEIHTSYEVFAELDMDQRSELELFIVNGSFVIHEIEKEKLHSIFGEISVGGLSRPDKTIIHLASHQKSIVLSGDLKLRRYCHDNNIEVHGVLWLFDKFIENHCISPAEATVHLIQLMRYNTWLPTQECEKRILKWKHHPE